MKKEEKIVMYDSDEAARFVTNVEGWVDRNGFFYGNRKDAEHCARYSGSTHKKCECNELMEKHLTLCHKCSEKKDIERHKQREVVEWDGETVLYSHYADEFFKDSDDIEDYCEENSINKDDMQLVLCDPVYFRHVDTDYWENDLPTEGGYEFGEIASKSVLELIDDLNKALRACGPVSWTPGKKAVRL
jgi:hypothetical protein